MNLHGDKPKIAPAPGAMSSMPRPGAPTFKIVCANTGMNWV